MELAMRIIRRQEVSVPGLLKIIDDAMEASEKTRTQICGESGFSTQYWSQLRGKSDPTLSEEKLRGIEKALGMDFGVNFDEP